MPAISLISIFVMMFFDFLYYSIYKFYSDYKENGAESTSAGVVGGLQASNILSFAMLFQLCFQQRAHINVFLAISLFIVFQVTTYYRYNYKDTHSVEVMEKKWLAKTEASRKQLTTILFVYGALSVILFFGLAIFLGNRNLA